MKIASKKITVLLLLAALVPGIAAYAILFQQAFSAPYQDDYHAILAFAEEYQQLPTWKARILAIAAEQHNEYKLAFEHSVVAAELQLTRHLNFFFLSVLGDLSLLPIAFLLWRTWHQEESSLAQRLLKFLPISFLFFALTYWETLDWAMTGLQNTPVILFSLLAIYLLIPRRRLAPQRAHLSLACLAAALAAFTSANGFLLAPVGLLILLPRRSYAWALSWCASFALPLAAYLYHIIPVAHPVNQYFYITRPLFFLAFLGGIIPSPTAAALLGLAIASVLILALRTRFDRMNPVASYFALWILLTAGVVAWVRGAVRFSVVSRYSIYSILLLIFCYGFLDHYLSTRSAPVARKWFYVTAIVGAVVFCVAADQHAWRKLAQRRHMVMEGIALYRANPALNSPMIDPHIKSAVPLEAEYERSVLSEAIHMGIYATGCSGCR